MAEYSRLGEDYCYKQNKDYNNDKILKFTTTNHADLLSARDTFNHFAINSKVSEGVTGDNVDNYSKLVDGYKSNMHSNKKCKDSLGELPLNMAYKAIGAVNNPDEENLVRFGHYNIKKNACLPKDVLYHDRHFYIFDFIEKPNALNGVEAYQHAGISARFLQRF